MSRVRWPATVMGALTLLVAAIGVVLLAHDGKPYTTARQEVLAKPTPMQSPPLALARQARPVSKAAPRRTVKATSSKPARKQAGPVAKVLTVAQAAGVPSNPLGWRRGMEWTIRVSEYDSHRPTLEWTTAEYRYTVAEADPAEGSLTLRMRFADLASQPESARRDLVRAGYVVENGRLRLAWVQPLGSGPQLSPEEAELLMGENALPLTVPEEPFAGGASIRTRAPGLGESRGNKLRLRDGETATYVRGAPWWVSFSRGADFKATMTSFTR